MRPWPLLVLAALALAPSAAACSVAYSTAAQVSVTETGLVWVRGGEVVRGEPGEEVAIGDASPFPRYHASPDGQVIYYSRGSGLGADCSVPFTSVFRWTPEGTENVTATLPRLPASIHWGTGRALFLDGGRALVKSLEGGETLATLEPATRERITGEPVPVRGAVWAPTGDRIALVTDDAVWILRDDGRAHSGDATGYHFGPGRNALVAFSQDGRALAVVSSEGDRFTEARTLDLAAPEGAPLLGTHLDVRGARAIAWRDDGALAIGWMSPFAEGSPGDARITLHNASLGLLGEVGWQDASFGDSLAWEGRSAVVVLDGRITRVRELEPPAEGFPEPPPATPAPPSPRDAVPFAPALAAILAALLLARRR